MSEWHIASMERLGASIQELAEEQYQELMGFEGEGGHRAPRTDIAKLKALWQMRQNARGTETGRGPGDPEDYGKGVAKVEWDRKTQMTADEYELVQVYSYALNKTMGPARGNPQVAFEQAVLVMSGEMPDWQRYVVNAIGGSYEDMKDLKPIYSEDEAKKVLGSGLKKQQTAEAPARYDAIRGVLDGLKQNYPESYKLWPWAVSQMKTRPGSDRMDFGGSHFMDVVGEAGKVMNDLRRENRLPQGLDINKMDVDKLEEWLMSWKRENRPAESQGEVVYEFKDGWTIQRLTTPEQLQFEGDEMGHCVGGYSGQVDSGVTNIYSLRDRKGSPHVTMEISGNRVYVPGDKVGESGLTTDEPRRGTRGRAMPRFEDEEDRQAHSNALMNTADNPWSAEKAQQNEERWPSHWHSEQNVGPHTMDPEEDYRDYTGLPATPEEFTVQQVQGQGNSTPKPEYTAKIKEFVEHLKSQGMKFERSTEWYPNQDDAGIDDWDEEPEVYSADDLDNWWSEYRHQPEYFLGGGEDQYGIKRQPRYGSGSFDDILSDFLGENQPGKESVEEWARELYHWAVLQNYSSGQLLQSLEQAKRHIDDTAGAEWDQMIDHDYVDVPYPSIDEFQDPDAEEIAMEKYYEELHEAESKWWEREWGTRWKLVQYLEAIVTNHGVVDKHQLPSPQAAIGGDGGIPSYAQYMNADQQAGEQGTETQSPFTWGTFSKVADWEPESDPGFLYVYYMSELHVVPWEVNLRYENMLRDLFDKFGVDMNNVLLDVDTSDVDAGEIRVYNAAPHVTHKQLCKPEVREHAEDAILEWWAGEQRMRHHDWWVEDEWQPYPQSINAG